MYVKLGTSKRIYLAKFRCEAISYQPRYKPNTCITYHTNAICVLKMKLGMNFIIYLFPYFHAEKIKFVKKYYRTSPSFFILLTSYCLQLV